MDLVVKEVNGQAVVDSREVAEMVEKQHKDLLRDIRKYIEVLNRGADLRSENFFIEGTYINSRNQEQPMYYLTKRGCDMVANKMTGEKGILFTAKYVDTFYKYEDALKNQQQLPFNVQIMQDMVMAMGKSIAEVTSTQVTKMQQDMSEFKTDVRILITEQDIQHKKRIEQTREMIGFRSKHTKELSKFLTSKLSELAGYRIDGKHDKYNYAKIKLFSKYGVSRWEDIPIDKYNCVFADIDSLEDMEDIRFE